MEAEPPSWWEKVGNGEGKLLDKPIYYNPTAPRDCSYLVWIESDFKQVTGKHRWKRDSDGEKVQGQNQPVPPKPPQTASRKRERGHGGSSGGRRRVISALGDAAHPFAAGFFNAAECRGG